MNAPERFFLGTEVHSMHFIFLVTHYGKYISLVSATGYLIAAADSERALEGALAHSVSVDVEEYRIGETFTEIVPTSDKDLRIGVVAHDSL